MSLRLPLQDLLSSQARVRILRTLLLAPGRTWTGREVSLEAGISVPQGIAALKVAEGKGLVWRARNGPNHEWRLVEEHALVDPLRALFGFERGFPERFRTDLTSALTSLPILRAILFGSVARGEESSGSDVDLYLEVADDLAASSVEESLTPITMRFIARYGVVVSALTYTVEQAKQAAGRPLFKRIRAEGIALIGAGS